jgi:SAM-dependent methyltransferase
MHEKIMMSETEFKKEYYEKIYPSGELKKTSINWWSVRFYALLSEKILKGRRGKILDIGCGIPFILARLEKEHETWGMDISGYAHEKGKAVAPRSRLFLSNIEEGVPAGIPGNYFDLIISKYIFEHLRNPEEVLVRCCALLAPGGRIIISVPNTESPVRKLKKDEWFGVTDTTHVSLLEPHEWTDMVKRNNLRIEKIFSDGFWDVPYVKFIPKWLQYPLFSIPSAIEVFLAYPMLPPKWGENIIIIARKVP